MPGYYTWGNLTRLKPLALVMEESREDPVPAGHGDSLAQPLLVVDDPDAAKTSSASALRKTLSVWDLMAYGVGSTVGAGIYSLLAPGVKQAGPGLLLSFLLGAISCVFTALCYSEFASRIPVAGSAYTYGYVAMGELTGWFIGWNLTLEYAISSAAVARGWGGYVNTLLDSFGAHPPKCLHACDLGGGVIASPLAALCVILLSLAMLPGVKESSRLNGIVTTSNVCVLLFVVILGATRVETGNWTIVQDSFVPYGSKGVFTAAGTVFFSYLGFDMVSSMAEEVKKPQRDMPIGIIGSLTIAACIYVAVTLVITGMVDFRTLESSDAPLSDAFSEVGIHWATYIINVGSVFGLTSACFTGLLGQPRIFYRMAKDGLLFPLFGRLSKKGVPLGGTLITAIITAVIAFAFTLDALSEAISIGTLAAFSTVDGGIIVLRRKDPNDSRRAIIGTLFFTICSFIAFLSKHEGWPLAVTIIFAVAALGFLVFLYTLPVNEPPSSFKCPLVPLTPCIGIALNMSMLSALKPQAWLRLAGWTFIGMCIYFGYGIRNSTLNKLAPATKDAAPGAGAGAGSHGKDAADADDDHVRTQLLLPVTDHDGHVQQRAAAPAGASRSGDAESKNL